LRSKPTPRLVKTVEPRRGILQAFSECRKRQTQVNMSTPIGPGKHVRLHLAVFLEDGTEVLSSLDAEPLEFQVGDGTLAPGLEELFQGILPGDDQQFLADGSAVFGDHDPDLIHHVPRSDLPADFQPNDGDIIQFQAPGGQETAGTVIGCSDDEVEIDFNHPLARRGLRIRVQVIAVS
jgi:FKBP-type peptidyl-prolyl cis-trans isomerase SlpA